MDLLSKYNKAIGLDWENAEEAKYYYNRAIVKDLRGDNVNMKGGTMESRNEHVPARVIKKENVWSIKEESGELIKAIMSFDEPVEAQITMEYKKEVLILRGRAEINNDYVTLVEPKVTPTTIMNNQTWTNADTWRAVDGSHISTGTINAQLLGHTHSSATTTTIDSEYAGWTSGNLRVDQDGITSGSVSISSGGVTWNTAQAIPRGTTATFYMNGQRIPAEIQTINLSTSDQGNVYETDGNRYSPHTRPGVSGGGTTITGTLQIDAEALSRMMNTYILNGPIEVREILNEGSDD